MHGGLLAEEADVRARPLIRELRKASIVEALSEALGQVGAHHRLPSLGTGEVHKHPLLQASQHRAVQVPGKVGSGKEEDLILGVTQEAVHLDEKLRLHPATALMLAVATTSGAHEGIELVDEDGGGLVMPGEIEEYADELLRVAAPLRDYCRGRNIEERGLTLRGHSLGQKRLPRARWAEEEHTLPRCQEPCEEVRVLQRHHHSLLEQGLGVAQAHDAVPSDPGVLRDDVPRNGSGQISELLVLAVSAWQGRTQLVVIGIVAILIRRGPPCPTSATAAPSDLGHALPHDEAFEAAAPWGARRRARRRLGLDGAWCPRRPFSVGVGVLGLRALAALPAFACRTLAGARLLRRSVRRQARQRDLPIDLLVLPLYLKLASQLRLPPETHLVEILILR
mmetsp:Transcript_110472/g.236049  ORF Transcript_110472/g.236049 Transcript_110472/m.236049 type:complete len:394 (+) Transcript_110472:366-1547(+)